MADLPGRNVPTDDESIAHKGLSGLENAFKPRHYQLEMLEESMRRNIIVAVRLPCVLFCLAADILQMDTGSGKT